MKKFLAVLLCVFACCFIAACGGEGQTDDAPKSTLIGTFTYSDALHESGLYNDRGEPEPLRIYGSEGSAASRGAHLYCTVYPFNQLGEGGNKVSYTFDQRLKLKRDFTYSYQYNITLTNSEDWGNDFARLSVVIEGEFFYEQLEDGTWQVGLDYPAAGSLTIYGATVSRTDIYGWAINSSATYVEDIAVELERNPYYEYSRYLTARTVVVNKEEKSVSDDIFYPDIMNDIAPYCDYQL